MSLVYTITILYLFQLYYYINYKFICYIQLFRYLSSLVCMVIISYVKKITSFKISNLFKIST